MEKFKASILFCEQLKHQLTKLMKKGPGLFLFLLLNAFIAAGCATSDGPTINYSLKDIDRAIKKTMPGGIAHISENGRTYYGNYFDPYSIDHKTNGPKDKRDFRRYRATATITGDRRPYTFDIRVDVEVRVHNARMPASKKFDVNSGVFVHHDTSPATEDRIYYNIQKSLRDRNEKANIIDNFQPF